MEKLRSNVNYIEYPNKETMDLFLKIGYDNNIFETVDRKLNNGTTEKIYKNANAVATLALTSDYLCKPGNENKKQLFLDEITNNNPIIYKKIGEFALDIREGMGELSKFSKELLQSNRERIKRVDPDIRCFPVISPEIIPSRYSGSKSNRLIHEEFESELARLNRVSEGTNQIQTESDKHKFNRGVVDPKMIEGLKDKL